MRRQLLRALAVAALLSLRSFAAEEPQPEPSTPPSSPPQAAAPSKPEAAPPAPATAPPGDRGSADNNITFPVDI